MPDCQARIAVYKIACRHGLWGQVTSYDLAKDFRLEEDLHRMVEDNLDVIFPGLKMVQREFKLKGAGIIDTLAYDPENQAFVIIEYKREKSKDIALQANVYKTAVKNNQDRCVVVLMNKLKLHLNVNDIKWSKTRMIFVKPGFTQQEIMGFGQEDLVDLCEVRKFSGRWIVNQFGREPKIRNISENSKVDQLANNGSAPSLSNDLYLDLKKAILDGFPVQHETKATYEGFYLKGHKLLCGIQNRQRGLKLIYATKEHDQLPHNNFVRKISDYWGRHYSILQQQSDIPTALKYLQMTYSLKSGSRRRS